MEQTVSTVDSLGIVTLATAAFKRGQISEAELGLLNECADDFTRALSLANKCREMTGTGLSLDDLPSPSELRRHIEGGGFAAALREAAVVKNKMQPLLLAARQRLSEAGLRIDR
jgi:hypothetical protein